MDKQIILTTALRTIQLETAAIAGLQPYINDEFVEIITTIATCSGRVIISGIGKSAIIAQKITATLNSTGTPSVFLHAADAIHGDLGIVQPNDIVIIISKSGDSPEIKVLVPLIKNFGNVLIGMVGNIESFLAKNANYILNTTVTQEACPNNLAPTSSTTAQMVMGDALAVSLMEIKGFNSENFAKFHPGGTLGKKLFLRVEDLISNNEKPEVTITSSIKEVIVEMTKKRLGTAVVIGKDKDICGIITDGDLRRMLEKNDSFIALTASDIMSQNPKTINEKAMAIDALEILRSNNISQLIVVDELNNYVGVLHIHDLIREGII